MLRTTLLEAAAGPLAEALPPALGAASTAFTLGLLTLRKVPSVCEPTSPVVAVHIASLALQADHQLEGQVAFWVDDLSFGAAVGWDWLRAWLQECAYVTPGPSMALSSYAIPSALVLGVKRFEGGALHVEELPRSASDGFTFLHAESQVALNGSAWRPDDVLTLVVSSSWVYEDSVCP